MRLYYTNLIFLLNKLSPNKDKNPFPLVHLDLNDYKLELIVKDRKKNILKVKEIIVTEYIDDLNYYMNKMEWLSNDEVGL